MRTVTFLVLEGVDKGRVYKDLPDPRDHRPRGGERPAAQRRARQPVPRQGSGGRQRHHPDRPRQHQRHPRQRHRDPDPPAPRRRSGVDRPDHAAVRHDGGDRGPAGHGDPGQRRRRRPRRSGRDELAAAAGRRGHQRQRADRSAPAGSATGAPFDDDIPPLPQKLSPSQAARLAEIFDYLHRGLTTAVENIDANEDGTEVRLGFGEWQTIQAVQMLLARYGRTIAEPEVKG